MGCRVIVVVAVVVVEQFIMSDRCSLPNPLRKKVFFFFWRTRNMHQRVLVSKREVIPPLMAPTVLQVEVLQLFSSLPADTPRSIRSTCVKSLTALKMKAFCGYTKTCKHDGDLPPLSTTWHYPLQFVSRMTCLLSTLSSLDFQGIFQWRVDPTRVSIVRRC